MKYLLIIFLIIRINAQNVRPVKDDVGFCWDAKGMDSLMSYLSSISEKEEFIPAGNLIAAISPHDDYLYAGRVYYPLYKHIKAKEIVIFGVTHGTVRKEIGDPKDLLLFESFDEWIAPYGNIKPSPLREYLINRLDKNYFAVNNKAHQLEHSIEALIPFLQYYNKDIKITPIMITAMTFAKIDEITTTAASIIKEYMNINNLQPGKDIFFLMSSDANHYGEDFSNAPFGIDEQAYNKAVSIDKQIVKETLEGGVTKKKIEDLTIRLFPDSSNNDIKPLWCGRYPIPFGLLTVTKIFNKELNGRLLLYSDTWKEGILPIRINKLGTTAPFSLRHWVGFFSAAFVGIYD